MPEISIHNSKSRSKIRSNFGGKYQIRDMNKKILDTPNNPPNKEKLIKLLKGKFAQKPGHYFPTLIVYKRIGDTTQYNPAIRKQMSYDVYESIIDVFWNKTEKEQEAKDKRDMKKYGRTF